MRHNAKLEHIAFKIPTYHDDEYDDSEILSPPPTYERVVAMDDEKKKLEQEANEIAGGDSNTEDEFSEIGKTVAERLEFGIDDEIESHKLVERNNK